MARKLALNIRDVNAPFAPLTWQQMNFNFSEVEVCFNELWEKEAQLRESVDSHAADKEIHKTSEQIRSEITDGNIPAAIARLAQVLEQVAVVVGNADSDYNTLGKLQVKVQRITSLLDGDNGDAIIETLQEALGFINEHKGSIESLVNTYVKKADIADNVTTDDSTKPLSARQGVILKGITETLSAALLTLQQRCDYLEAHQTGGGIVIPLLSEV